MCQDDLNPSKAGFIALLIYWPPEPRPNNHGACSKLWSLVEMRNNGSCLPRDIVNVGRTLEKGSISWLQ